MNPAPSPPSSVPTRAWLLGALGVLAFALSVPMTRLATGSVELPGLPPLFVGIARCAIAGALAAAYLLAVRAPWPTPMQWRWLLAMTVGVVFGWPVLLALAVREVDAVHASVLSGLLPLATAAMAVGLLRERAPWRFWFWALVGLALVLVYAFLRGAGRPVPADGVLLLAVLLAASGYVAGTRLTRWLSMPPEQVISWGVLMWWLPCLAWCVWKWPPQPVAAVHWLGLGYVGVVSSWLGFFAWYRALALGGALRVGQVQVAQPFLSGLLAVPLLGEALDPLTGLFLLLVVSTVLMGQRARRAA
ncbi:DMT family transporter [Inhella sp.]|uniref:DMT family transporter n=1 Tax=Inhella sp. TaxID=1921806 RepID=UPI0035B06991